MVYTTAEKIQAELRAANAFSGSTNPSLDTVNDWIEQITDVIDSLSGQSWESTAYTDYFDYNGIPELYLKHTPLISVTNLSYNENSQGEAPSYVPTTEDVDFVSYDELGMLSINTNKFMPKIGAKRGLKVDYVAGYSPVPPRIELLATKMATERVLTSLMNDNLESRNAGGSISVGSINIVEPADYGINTYKQLQSDIKSLTETLTNSGFRVHRYG